MATAILCRVTDTAKRSEAVKGGTYRMILSKSGRYIPRDSKYPLLGPVDIAKSGVVEERKVVTNEKPQEGGSEIQQHS